MRRPQAGRLLALLAFLGLGASPRAEAATTRTFALLVAVGEYPFLARALGEERYRREVRLEGPVHDAALLREVLIRRLGVPPERIEVLDAGPEAPVRAPTRRNVVGALRRLAREVKPRDLVFVALSGHGTQEIDRSGDEVHDEVFLAADARGVTAGSPEIPGGLADDELGDRLRAIRDAGARVVLVVDCCHAGTMARGGLPGARVRRLDPALLDVGGASGRRKAPATEDALRLGADLRGITALYAARDDELAVEMPLPLGAAAPRAYGVFTWALAGELARTGGTTPWREVIARVAGTVRSLGVHGAHPNGEGELDTSWSPRLGTMLEFPAWREGDAVVLEAGAVDGLALGARVVVKPARGPGSIGGTPARIERVEALSATARLEYPDVAADWPAGGPEDPPLRAQLYAPPLGPTTLPLALVDGAGTSLALEAWPPAWRATLSSDLLRGSFPLVGAPAEAAWLLVAEGGEVLLRPAKGLGASIASWVVAPEDLAARLAQIARVDRLVRLAGEPGTPAAPKGLELVGTLDVGSAAAPRLVPLREGGRVRPGDRLAFDARNTTSKAQDVWAFLLDADFGLTCVFPDAQRSARLDPGASARLVEGVVNDETLGEEHLLVVVVPARKGALPADLRWLEVPPLERSAVDRAEAQGSGNLGEHLAAAAFGDVAPPGLARGGRSELEGGILLRTWETTWEPVLPRERPSVPPDAVRAPGRPDTEDWDPWWSGGAAWFPGRGEVAGRCDLLHVVGDHGVGLHLAAGPGVAEADLAATAFERLVLARGFPSVLALRWETSGARSVAYDRDGDGRFDLVLVDREGGPEAEERHVLDGARWRTERGRLVPLLQVARLRGARGPDPSGSLTARLRALLRGAE